SACAVAGAIVTAKANTDQLLHCNRIKSRLPQKGQALLRMTSPQLPHSILVAAVVIVVPASPRSMFARSFRAPIAAGLPVASAKWHAASTFGPIEPAGKLKPRMVSGAARRIARAVGLPQ